MFNNGDKVKHTGLDEVFTYVGVDPNTPNAAVVTYDDSFKAFSLDDLVAYAWYDNIPKGGVLCRVHDHNNQIKAIHVIVGQDNDGNGFKSISGSTWRYATPLTKGEIKQFIDNCPND